MKKTILYVGALVISCSNLLAQQSSSSSIIDNDVLFDVTFDSTTVHDQSSFLLLGQQNGVILSNGKAAFYQSPNSTINYGMPSHLNNEGDFSISLWYNGGSEAVGDYELLFQKGDIEIALYDLNTPLVKSKDNSIWDNSWNQNAYDFRTKKYNIGYSYKDKQHLIVTKKSDSLYFYRNNELKGKSKYISNSTIDNIVKIGNNFRSDIDRITIYDGVLSNSEIEGAFYYNADIIIPSSCSDNLFFESINLIKGEGNVFYSCGENDMNNSENNLISFIDSAKYESIKGTAFLSYPNGTLVIRDFNQSSETLKLTEYGTYVLRFVKSDNCKIEKEFSFEPSPSKPSISAIYPKNVLCGDKGVYIHYTLDNLYVKEDINGFEWYAPFYITNLDKPSDNKDYMQNKNGEDSLLVFETGTYQLNVDYPRCLRPQYESNTVQVIEDQEYCNSQVLGLGLETNTELSFYPNPVKASFVLNADVNGEFEMNSALGESFNIKIVNGNASMEHLPAGIYILLINDKTLKIIKI